MRVVVFGAGGFAVGVAMTWGLVLLLSGNTHDLSVEAPMTAFFVGGPAGALLGIVTGVLGRRRPR
jgi:hypothetical protein